MLKNGPSDNNHRVSQLIYIYIYIYIYIEECIIRQRVVIKASFTKNDGTLFIIFNCNFSSLLVSFLVWGSRWQRSYPISSTQALPIMISVVIRGSVV